VLPSGVAANPASSNCNGSFILLIPFLLNGILSIASQLLLGRRGVRNKIRFWSYSYLDADTKDGRWMPWSALAGVASSIIVAVVSVVLLRAGGLNIEYGQTILLWLTRPRVNWVVIMASTCLYKSLTETATDLLFQDCVLAVLGIPFAAVVLSVTVGGSTPAGCESSGFHSYNDVLFESGSPLSIFWGGAVGLIVSGSILLFVGVAMLWKFRFLKRALIILAAIPCMASFASSWLLWIGFAQVASDGSFCPPNIAPIAVLHGVLPIINGVLRSWVGYPGN